MNTSINRLDAYCRASLEALPVPGETGLRSLIRKELAAGNISGVTGTQIAGMGKEACIALLLGEATPLAATPAAPMMQTTGGAPMPVGDNGMAALAGMLAPFLGAAVNRDEVEALAARAFQSQLAPALDAMQKAGDGLAKRAETFVDECRNGLVEALDNFKKEVWASRPVEWRVINAAGKSSDVGRQHKSFGDLLALLEAGLNVWLVGPAGSGKTTAAEFAAKALGRRFYFNGAIDSEYKLLGFVDAGGKVISRPFREAWEQGGVYLFDEVDASLPSALLAFNAALANGVCDFPDACIPKHPDFVCIAGGNVWNGATSEYCGRMKQDAAFLDRFVQLEWSYDEALEVEIATCAAVSIAKANGGDEKAAMVAATEWTDYVQAMRKRAKDHGIKIVISPRASMNGAKLLAAGKLSLERVQSVTLRKGLDKDTWAKLQG